MYRCRNRAGYPWGWVVTAPRRPRTIRLPLLPGTEALLQAPFPLTEEEWQRLMLLLQAMRVGLVEAPLPELSFAVEPSGRIEAKLSRKAGS